ncbi:unnamed protein product [Clonostachys chloroleuca]|uniref:HNH nuclease domain-containing protein n=1 Tax=Clonostachys chloroleuca TaxID=1926264 RepID=A0AA35MEJ5_9HYPO|nr:unnamed protein product [Clonostachys chloroleuca]
MSFGPSRFVSREGTVARDDEGNPTDNETQVDPLEVVHIIPHSLTRLNASNKLDTSKATALAILNMFDNGAAYLIEGVDIDRPRNAITLTCPIYYSFRGVLPATRTLYLTELRTIDPPLPRLLAIYNAIRHIILYLSGAGEYIDEILEDLDGQIVREDGCTKLDLLVKLKL